MKQIITIMLACFLTSNVFSQTQQVWTNYTTVNSGLMDDDVLSIAIDSQGNKWVGTYGGGVSKFDGTTWITYTTGNSGLVSDEVRSISIDSQGNKWVGTYGGVSKFAGTTWTTYTTVNSGLVDDNVLSIAIDSQGNKWFGTYGGVSKFDGTTWTTYTTVNSGLVYGDIYSIAIDSQGNKWFGTGNGNGLSKFDGTTWTTYTTGNSGLVNDQVRSIAIDLQGNKWFGTFAGGVSKFDGTTWTTYTTVNSGLGYDWVFSIVIDSQGNKWFGTFGGGVSKLVEIYFYNGNYFNTSMANSCGITKDTTNCLTAQYSTISGITGGNTYTFESSVGTDYITITNNNNLNGAIYASGTTPLIWKAPSSGTVRFYTHLDYLYNYDSTTRVRSITSNIPTANATPLGIPNFCMGGNVVLSADTGMNYTYQWKKNGSNLAGGTNNSYTATLTGNYTVVTALGTCKDTSNGINVMVNPLPPATLTNVGSLIFCDGKSVTLNANPGNGLMYEWQNTGVLINGVTTASYIATTAGDYTVIVTDSNSCSKTSAIKTVVVNPTPVATVTTSGPTAVCHGGSVALSTPATGGYTFQWKKNNTNISGATSNNYMATQTGNYLVIVTLGTCKDTSVVTNVLINSLINASLTSTPNNGTNNGTATVSPSGGTLPYQYSWSNGQTSNPTTGLSTATYGVTITDSIGCTYQSNISVSSNVGMVNSLIDITTFDVFPNPTNSSLFNLSILSTQSNDFTITIYNHLGQKIITQEYLNTQSITDKLEVSAFAKGIYLIELVTPSGKMTKKLMIE